jgi:CheY-like chemotaxis protein
MVRVHAFRMRRSSRNDMARVLVVDDSEDLQEVFAMALPDEGFMVLSALDGKRGLELMGELRPDVVLLDMMMPEMDGLEFLSLLAMRPSPPPVVAQSGFHHLRSEALHRGAHSFLAKPFSMTTLVGALEAAIASRPVAAALMMQNAAEVEHARQLAIEGSARALAQLGLSEPAIRDCLRRVPRWLTGYFGFGTAEVTFLDALGLRTEAVDAARMGLAEGKTIPREDAFCDEVIAAGSTLVLEDPARHPSERIARHRQVLAGWNFYAGVPLRVANGPAIGTVCLEDTSPHQFHGEDMRVLEAMGRGLARALETRSWPIDGAGALGREYLGVLIEAASTRVTRSGAIAAMIVEAATRVPRATGLAAIRLDTSRMLLLWSGRAGAWSPPETVEGHVLVTADLSRVHDGITAREQLHAVCR